MKVLALLVSVLCVATANAFQVSKTVSGGDYVIVIATPTTTTGQLDVLFLVDNSGSMQSHQQRLASNTSFLVNALTKVQGASIHAGVITTDMEDTRQSGKILGGVLDSSSANFSTQLAANIMVGTYGSGYEHMFAPLIEALGPLANTANAGFRREDAHLAVVTLTDAEDQSEKPAATPVPFPFPIPTPTPAPTPAPANGITVDQFVKQMTGFGTSGLSMYSFVIPTSYGPSSTGACPRDEYTTPVRIESATTALKGEIFDICQNDFGKNLDSIGKKLATVIDRKIKLPNEPQLTTIEVKFGTVVLSQDLHTGWSYDSVANEIVIGDLVDFSTQPKGSELRVKYVPVGW